MKKVAIVTSKELSKLEPDERRLCDLLAPLHVQAEAAIWNDPSVAWETYDLVLFRTCWDYFLDRDGFRAFLTHLEGCNPNVWNPTDLIRWNMHKEYLLELEARGIDIVPMELIRQGDSVILEDVARMRGWDKVLVKPAISAGSHETWLVENGISEVHQQKFDRQIRETDLLIQPFIPEVRAKGEISLIFLGGPFSHAVLKSPTGGDFRVQEQFGGKVEAITPPDSAIQTAYDALAALGHGWLYARADLLEHEGVWMLIELELIEPNLFLGFGGEATAQFAKSIAMALEMT